MFTEPMGPPQEPTACRGQGGARGGGLREPNMLCLIYDSRQHGAMYTFATGLTSFSFLNEERVIPHVCKNLQTVIKAQGASPLR